ncbi:MAG: hypothetical protein LPH21_17425 [Shewanella sp.]|nr:hypothetical protein [Shewanella sp.]
MTPEELEIRKAEIDARTKRYELRSSVWKVGLGTALVGIAAAFFPFAQQYATEYFAVKIEVLKQEAASNIAERDAVVSGTNLNRKFLDSISEEGRSKNLDDRIVLAEYYAYLSDQGEERTRWKDFLKHLYSLREAKRAAVVNAVTKATDESATPTEVAVAQANARLLVESAAPNQRQAEAEPLNDIQSLLDSLDSDDTAVRRRSRVLLGNKGLAIVRPLMIRLSDDTTSYRTKLGILVAFKELMQKNKSNRKQISNLLQFDDLETLLQLSIHDDRMIRIYASEFLFNLGDPQLFDFGLAYWNSTTTNNGKFNLALIFKGLAPNVPESERVEIRQKLQSLLGTVGPKTDALLNDAILFLGSSR